MTDKQLPKPTEAEIEILQLLWKNGPSTVRQINDILNVGRDVGYTTTLKIMQIMHEKGLVTRDTANKSHTYFAALTEKNGKKMLLDKMLNTAFGGSALNLVLQTLGNYKTTKEEIDQLKDYIKEIESKRK